MSGNTRPQSSLLAELLWTDPDLKSGICVRKLISTLKKTQVQPSPQTSEKKPPPVKPQNRNHKTKKIGPILVLSSWFAVGPHALKCPFVLNLNSYPFGNFLFCSQSGLWRTTHQSTNEMVDSHWADGRRKGAVSAWSHESAWESTSPAISHRLARQ